MEYIDIERVDVEKDKEEIKTALKDIELECEELKKKGVSDQEILEAVLLKYFF